MLTAHSEANRSCNHISYRQYRHSGTSGDAYAHSQYRLSGRALGGSTTTRRASVAWTASQTTRTGGGGKRHSSGHWSARRFFEARAGCAVSSRILWQLWVCSSVRLRNSSSRALHTGDGKKATERPSVRAVNPCGKARSVEPTRTCTAMTAAAPRKHQSLRLLCEYYLLSNGRSQACATQTAGVCFDTGRSRYPPDVVHKWRGVGTCRWPTATRRGLL